MCLFFAYQLNLNYYKYVRAEEIICMIIKKKRTKYSIVYFEAVEIERNGITAQMWFFVFRSDANHSALLAAIHLQSGRLSSSCRPGANVVSQAVISRLRLQDNVLRQHKSFRSVSLFRVVKGRMSETECLNPPVWIRGCRSRSRGEIIKLYYKKKIQGSRCAIQSISGSSISNLYLPFPFLTYQIYIRTNHNSTRQHRH